MLRSIITAIYFGFYVLISIPGLLYVHILKSLGKIDMADEFTYRISGHWARSMVWFAGGKVTVTGAENIPEGPVLFIANHQGIFDIPLMLGYIKKYKGFVAKIEMLKLPIFRDWMKNLNCVFMDRNDIRQSVQIISNAAEILKGGFSLTIFPEGTRSKSDTVGEFKAGSLKLGVKAGVPIVPVTIDGSYKLYEQHKRLHPANIALHIGQPINTKDITKEDLRDLPDKIRNIIIEQRDGSPV